MTPRPQLAHHHRQTTGRALDYDRARDLPRLLPLWPDEWRALEAGTPEARQSLVRRLHAALRAERRRGRAGQWCYDLSRHMALRRAYRAESAALSAAQSAALKPCEETTPTSKSPAALAHPCEALT